MLREVSQIASVGMVAILCLWYVCFLINSVLTLAFIQLVLKLPFVQLVTIKHLINHLNFFILDQCCT